MVPCPLRPKGWTGHRDARGSTNDPTSATSPTIVRQTARRVEGGPSAPDQDGSQSLGRIDSQIAASPDSPFRPRDEEPREPEPLRLPPPHGEQPPLPVDVGLRPTADGVLTKDPSGLDAVGLLAETDDLRAADR